MLLTGFHPRVMDQKKRVAIPKPVRDALGAEPSLKLFVVPDQVGCLRVYREPELADHGQRQVGSAEGDMQAQARRRAFFGQAQCLQLDRQGRLLIPQRLVRHAGLTRRVILIGVHDHLELWNPERLKSHLRQAGISWEDLGLP